MLIFPSFCFGDPTQEWRMRSSRRWKKQDGGTWEGTERIPFFSTGEEPREGGKRNQMFWELEEQELHVPSPCVSSRRMEDGEDV